MAIVSTFLWNGYRIDITDDTRVDRRVLLTYDGSANITLNADSLWTSFAASYPQYAGSGRFYQVDTGSGADVITKSSGGGIFSGSGADTITSFATTGPSQVHIYAAAGNDTINLSFSNIGAGFSEGHHVYAEEENTPTTLGNDSFNFQSTTSVGAGEIVVGRLDDFDPTRDTLRINGAVVNLNALPTGVKIVMHNGETTDADAPAQQWLVIKTSGGGYILYTLEGARQIAGTGAHGSEEEHFIDAAAANAIIAIYESQPSAWYVSPDNYVPAGLTAQGGVVINDDDDMAHDVMDIVSGGTLGDLIAAGLNNDTVNAGSGNDQVWGGSGHDVVNGEAGNDTLYGNLGNDVVNGGDGDDLIYYQEGADSLYGGAGIDTLVISSATAPSISLQNVTNNQTIVVSGIENLTGSGRNDSLAGDGLANVLRGDDGQDSLTGWGGADTMYGGDGADFLGGLGQADVLFGGAGADTLQGGTGVDDLTGGAGADVFRFVAVSEGGDAIDDFSGTLGGQADKISIKVSGFNTAPSTGLVAGNLTMAQFWSSTSNVAHDLTDRFIFRTGDKTLWFDADGNLAGGVAAVLVADLQDSAANVVYQDIVLY